MAQVVIPANQQGPGQLMGGFWVVLQTWPIANQYAVALLGPEGMKVTVSGGGWTTVPVPRDVGITEWEHRPNFEATLDLLFDGWITHPIRPVLPASLWGPPNLPLGVRYSRGGLWMEGAIKHLEDLALPHPPEQPAPPSLRIYGAVPHPEVRWVINGLDWGDSLRDKVTGRRMRQQVTVKLLEYNQPTELAKLPRPVVQAAAVFKVQQDKNVKQKRRWMVTNAKKGKVVARFATQASAQRDCKARIKRNPTGK